MISKAGRYNILCMLFIVFIFFILSVVSAEEFFTGGSSEQEQGNFSQESFSSVPYSCYSYSSGSTYVRICGSAYSISSESGEYLNVYCTSGDLYLNPIAIYDSGTCYDEGQPSLCYCNEDGCTGTSLSSPYNYTIQSSDKNITFICYKKDAQSNWAYISIKYKRGLNVMLSPDFFSEPEFTQAEQVNYSQVFPPNLSCNISIGKFSLLGNYYVLDSNAEKNLLVKFKKENTGQIIHTENSFSCSGSCSLNIPEAASIIISPEDSISCEAQAVDNSIKAKESNIVNIPSFDLFIKNISAINVIEDVPLIVDKPLMVRVWAFFKSNLITNMDKDVDVKIKYHFPSFVLLQTKTIPFKPMKDFNLEDVKDNIRANPENPSEKNMTILRKVKSGNDSANFFNLPPPYYKAEGIHVQIIAEVDPDNLFNESYDSNDEPNDKTEVFDVEETREIKILYVSVELVDIGPWYQTEEKKIRNTYTYPYETSFTFKNQLQFFEKVYPLVKYNIKTSPEKMRVIVSTEWCWGDKLEDVGLWRMGYIRDQIYSKLQKIAKEEKVDIVVGFVDKRILRQEVGKLGVNGLTKPGLHWYDKWDGYNNVVLLGVDKTGLETVMAHEIGHLNGLKDTNTKLGNSSGNGIPSHNGWLLEQRTGHNLEPRVNIWNDPDGNGNYDPGRDAAWVNGKFWDLTNPGSYFNQNLPADVGVTEDIFLYLDIMGNTNDEKKVHMNKEQYEVLLNNYEK